MFDGIILESGQPLDEQTLNPIMGYQAEHKVTGRLLPMCQRFEIYGKNALKDKIFQVATALENSDFVICEYHSVPVYMNELNENLTGFICIMNENDFKENEPFN